MKRTVGSRFWLLGLLILGLGVWAGAQQPDELEDSPLTGTHMLLLSQSNPIAVLVAELDGKFGQDLIVLNSGPSPTMRARYKAEIERLIEDLRRGGTDLEEKEVGQLEALPDRLATVGSVATFYGTKDGRFWDVAETLLYREEGRFEVTPQGTLRVEKAFSGEEPSAIAWINSGNGCGKVLVASNRSPFIFNLDGAKLENVGFAECDGSRECVQGDPSMAVADLTGDGVPDLALTSTASFTVAVYRGVGACKFSLLQEWTVGSAGDEPRFVTVGDVNNDGMNDLVVTKGGILSRTVQVILGNGDGTFQAPREFMATERPQSAVVGDFDNDAKPDLLVAGISSLVFLKGDNRGNFGGKVPAGSLNIPRDLPVPIGLVTADFDRDGNLDAAVANYGKGSVDVLFGTGEGSFNVVSFPLGSGSFPIDLAAADLDADLDPDLVVVAQGSDEVVVLLNVGGRTFIKHPTPRLGWGVTSMAAGKLNMDTVEDPAISDLALGRLALEPSSGITMPYKDDRIENTVVAKLIDKVTIDLQKVSTGGEIQAFYNEGDGSFTTSSDLQARVQNVFYFTSVISRNFDEAETSDQHELITTGFTGDAVVLCSIERVKRAGKEIQTLKCQNLPLNDAVPAPRWKGPRAVVAGHFGDVKGPLDLAVANFGLRNVYVLLGRLEDRGDGTFRYAGDWCKTSGTLNAQPTALAVADFNGDGYDDLAVVNRGTGEILIFEQQVEGQPQEHCQGVFRLGTLVSLGAGTLPTSIVSEDFDGDRDPDLAVTNAAVDAVAILLNDGTGRTFTPADGSPIQVGEAPMAIVAADFDRDGDADLAVANYLSDSVTLLCGDGQGAFPKRTQITEGNPSLADPAESALQPLRGGPIALAVGKFDDSGKEDPSLDLAIGVQFPTSDPNAQLQFNGVRVWPSVWIRYGPLACDEENRP